ncbi:YesL family protein [Jeotgalibaca sp. A122]|uniref:YesL family protein n=1 Tax=Jeotgalibaca sp. A122 TaxID=3457322 RepID=UPI003FD66572
MYESEETLSHGLMRTMQWFSSLVYLNILWFVGVLAGGVLLGIGPATLALCAVLRALIWERKDVVINEFFYEVYRRVWNESIRFMIPLYAVLAFSWVNYRVIATFAPVVMPVFVVLWVIIFLTISYFFIFYGTLAGSPWQKLKDSLVLPWMFPLQSLGMLVGVGAIWLLNWRFSVVGVLFLFSAPVALYYCLLRKKYWRHFRVK